MTHDSLIIPSASSISPAVSLAKTDSSVSYYNDYLVDVPSNDRSLREESSSGIRILQQEHESCDGNGGIDSHIWFPPEPEDREADMEGSIGNYEDDDDDEEYGDGMKWGKPSNLSSLREEGCGSFRFREETKKAMDEVMNGKFKALVEHLLTSMGISCSGNDMDTDTDTWVDTVTALSWEAASYLKPDAFEGKAMDPDGYVKIKCFATGSRTQSKVFKGLVFKKHAAHKHMPTKYRKPKLLLIKGALSVSSDGLSSFESMKQENERLDYLIGMIEKLNPNVVLVEKTVSRDIQESILAKGMTLVLEMKLHRLERVARCTGSPILSSDMLLLNDQKLRQCESFYFEKIVEEHAALCDNGKRPKKTLMFLQGCPTRMGFTILLMGSHSDELKTIKCVVQFAVVMAYHLILESSFLVNQRAMLSTTAPNGMAILSTKPVFVYKGLDIPVASESSMETTTSDNLITTIDIPISNGFLQENGPDNLGLEGHSLSSYEPYDPIVLSGLSSLSASLQEVVGYPLFNATPQDQDHEEEEEEEETYLGYNTPLDRTETSSPDTETELLRRNLSLETKDSEERMQRKDDITAVLDSESILVLMSRRNVTRGTTCKQSSFSCIKFYRNFDVPLGKFLQDNLLNQKLLCGTCNELPEAHLSYYAHQNKQLTIQVKRLPSDKQLPGENEGKLWMWSCCGQCKPSNGSLKSTKRVLVSVAARGLSFGKFLELGFSNHSSWEIPSSCGHSSYADYFHFFGSGSMVAMFRYSTVATYSVSLPHWKVEFTNSIERDFLKEEVADVYQEGQSVFAEVENSLKKMEDKFGGSTLNIQGSCKRFSDIKEMLNKEQDEYEVNMKKLSESTSMTKWLYKPLHLNYIQWEVLLRSYIWDERIHSLLSSNLIRVTIDPQTVRESQRPHLQEKDTTTISITENGEPVSDNIKIYTHTPEPREANGLSVQPITTEAVVDDENGGVSSAFSSKSADPKGWMWTPFSHIESIYVKDLHRGYLPKYEASGSSRIHKMITQSQGEEGSKIHFPLGLGTENLLMVSDYEDELSSMIACALAFLKDGNSNTSLEFVSDDSKSYESLPKMLSLSSPNWSSFTSMDSDVEDSRFSSFDGLELLDSVAANSRYLHPVISMGRLANRSKYSVACLFAKDFLDLRGQCGLSELDYISSLSRCKHWDAKGGKSKSFFAKTFDDRFIIKEIKKTEFYSFLEFASHYFGYMNQCFKLGNQTCLAKILGIYQVKKRKSGAKHDLMVMENISYGRKITRQYDLKGALYARFNAVVDGTGDVLLDQNFVNDMNVSPLYVNTKAKRNLQRAVWNDTAFLNSINVMDYSLLVGVDVEEKELVCGIIDYVRQYTWDKQLENWVKSFVVPKNQLPTIISPKEYKKRFRKFIDTHFFSVPDDWCSQRPSNRCTLCGSNTPNPKMK